jgi:two-component system, NtrC family, sensor kinase
MEPNSESSAQISIFTPESAGIVLEYANARPEVRISQMRRSGKSRMPEIVSTADDVPEFPGTIELLHAQALEALCDGVWIARMDGVLIYRNAIASVMESMQWWHAGNTAPMAELVFCPALLERLHHGGVELGEYQLIARRGDGERDRNIGMEIRVLRGSQGEATGLLLYARDVSQEWVREQSLQDRNVELEQAYARVKETQTQLLQSEKMASIGQLAAGVAHEINNPIGYVHSNLGTLQNYARGLLSLLEAYDRLAESLPESFRSAVQPINDLKAQVDYAFLQQDLPQLVEESREGIERVKKIVLDLRDFSHAGGLEGDNWEFVDVHRGLQSTINIVWNELKYKAEVLQELGQLPLVECIPSQINQVFLNLLVNAGHAIADKGVITIRTAHLGEEVCISISDSGCGIPEENLPRIFDPFYTTKVVGKGTGLGLTLSYGIVQKHGGRIEVESKQGAGTTFSVYLPVRHVTVNAE